MTSAGRSQQISGEDGGNARLSQVALIAMVGLVIAARSSRGTRHWEGGRAIEGKERVKSTRGCSSISWRIDTADRSREETCYRGRLPAPLAGTDYRAPRAAELGGMGDMPTVMAIASSKARGNSCSGAKRYSTERPCASWLGRGCDRRYWSPDAPPRTLRHGNSHGGEPFVSLGGIDAHSNAAVWTGDCHVLDSIYCYRPPGNRGRPEGAERLGILCDRQSPLGRAGMRKLRLDGLCKCRVESHRLYQSPARSGSNR